MALEDVVKTTAIAFFVGMIPAMMLNALVGYIGAFSWVLYFVYALMLYWAVPKLPREADTFFDVLVVTFMLLGISGLIGMFIPQIAGLQWVSISSTPALLTTLTVAIAALAIREEYLDFV